MTSSSSARERRRQDRRPIWLVASLGVNLVLIGLISAWVLAMPPPRPSLPVWQRELVPSLSPTDAAIANEAIERIAKAQGQGARSIHADFVKVSALLAVEPLDQDALKRTLDNMLEVRSDQQRDVNQAFFDELVALSADGRAKMLGALRVQGRLWRLPEGSH